MTKATTTTNPEAEARRLEQQAQDLRAKAEADRLAAVAEREERTTTVLTEALEEHDPKALRQAVVDARADLVVHLRRDVLGAALLAYEVAIRRERTAAARARSLAGQLGRPVPQNPLHLRTGTGAGIRGWGNAEGLNPDTTSGFQLRELSDIVTECAEAVVDAERQAQDAELNAAITDGGRLNGARRTRAERDVIKRKAELENKFMNQHGFANAHELTGDERTAALKLAQERKVEADERMRKQQLADRAQVRANYGRTS